jgi:integrase
VHHFRGRCIQIKATKVKEMTFYLRDNGTYQSKVTINGRRKTFYGKTKNEVRLKYQECLKDINANGFQDKCSLTLNEYMEYWLETYKLKTIEPSSYDKLESVYLHQVKNTIGSLKLSNITTKDIQDLIDNYASPKNRSTKPLAKSGLKRLQQLLNQCFKKAVQEKRISTNPCAGVYIPNDVFIDTETRQQFSLNDSQMLELKKLALTKTKYGKSKCGEGYKYRDGLVLLVMLNTGLRSGEMLALEWTDVDLENKTLSVNKIMQNKVVDRTDSEHRRVDRVKNGSKTQAGHRVIPINDATVGYFSEIQKNNAMLGIKSKYVCSTRTGTRQSYRNLIRSLNTIQKQSETIPQDVTLHTLRHTFGSKLIRSGVDVSVVSKLMGHANITVTYNKYIHVIQEETAKAMKLVEIV